MKNSVQPGNTMTLTAPYAVTSGDGLLVGSIFGIASGDSDQKPMKRKRGRPRKGEERPPKDKTRLERQAAGDMTLEQMLDDLPKDCDRGAKVNAQGFRNAWIGYKFHIDAIDNGIPVVCILTSASVHDSQVAIPLAEMTAQQITYLQRLPLTFELASLATTLGVRHGLVILDAQQYHSGGCLVGGTSVKGGIVFERVLICYGPVGNISASSGLLILLDMAR